MSQQEFIPESQDNEEPQKQSYSQYRTSDMPKRDHPSDYSGSIPAYSYPAQDTGSSKQQQAQADQMPHSQQSTQSSARQQAGKQQQTSSNTARKRQQTYTKQRQSFFQNQNWSRQSNMPPYMGSRTRTKTAPNWFAILVIVCVVLFVVPLLLRLLFALFIVLFVMGLFLMILVGILILIYLFYFKKRLQRSRWWPW